MKESPESELGGLVQQVIGLANRRSGGQSTRFLYESGLSLPQITLLYTLIAHGDLPISGVAERIDMSMGATSQLISRLAEANYIAREENPNDRRVRIVRIAPKGVALVDRFNEVRERALAEAFDRLSPDLRIRLTNVLRETLLALESPFSDDAAGERRPPGR